MGNELRYYLYISDSKVEMLVEQLEKKGRINIENFELSLGSFWASIKAKITRRETTETIYENLGKILDYLNKNNKIGTEKELMNFNYPYIKTIDSFRVIKSSNSEEHPYPHCQFIRYKESEKIKNLVFLVGSSAYLMPRNERLSEPLRVSHHFDYLENDLKTSSWDRVSYDVLELYKDLYREGEKLRLETVFRVLHRAFIKDGKTIGT